jgi:DNA integrity scanning protein DisA with diadenylate cyclase activity
MYFPSSLSDLMYFICRIQMVSVPSNNGPLLEQDDSLYLKNVDFIIERCSQLSDTLEDVKADLNEMRDNLRQWRRRVVNHRRN